MEVEKSSVGKKFKEPVLTPPKKNYPLYICIGIIIFLIFIIVLLGVLLIKPSKLSFDGGSEEEEEDDTDDLERDLAERKKSFDKRNKERADEILKDISEKIEETQEPDDGLEIIEVENSE